MSTKPFTVLITGPESSGKSTLARGLAAAFCGVYVAEYAREYLEARGGVYEQTDLDNILEGQLAAQRKAVESGVSPMFCDTGPGVLYVWSKDKYGSVSPTIEQAFRAATYDATLLCYPDLEWEPDPLREHAATEDRERLFGIYKELTCGYPNRFIIRGHDRLALAQSHLNKLPTNG